MRKAGSNQLILPAPDPDVLALSEAYLATAIRTLDAGCGNGRNSIHLAMHGHTVTGIDKDPVMVHEARTWVRALGSKALNLSFRQADMLSLPYAVPCFEAVFATRSLQELSDRRQVRKAIAGIQQVTITGGLNFITAYTGTRRQQESKPNLTILNPDEIAAMYTDDGWSIVHSTQDLSRPFVRPDGGTIVRSYDEIIARKPEPKSGEQSQLDFA